jgi:hypothetical protein
MKLLRILAASSLVFLFSCQREIDTSVPSGKLTLNFTNLAGTQPLAFNTPYLTNNGEDFMVTRLKYYISNITLIDSAGFAHSLPSEYFLTDQSKPSSLSLTVNIDQGRYRELRFNVGVDSIRNVSGAQTGALDPALDMFWTWNTGYIMAKLEGTSSLSTLPNNRIEYHIGGFKGADNTTRTVSLSFPQVFPVTGDKTLAVYVSADVLDWFDSVNSLPISQFPTCTSPGLLATQFADNYSQMFQLVSLQSQ